MISHLQTTCCRFGLSPANRRSALIAITCFLLLGGALPGRILYQRLEIVDSAGAVQSTVQLKTTDPRLALLTNSIIAVQSAQATKPDAYFISRWEMELAEIYSKDLRAAESQESTESTESIAQASYVVHPASITATPASSVSKRSDSNDWTEYWKRLQVEATSRVLQYQQPAATIPVQARTRLADITPGARTSFWFAIQLSLAVSIFLLAQRLQSHAPSKWLAIFRQDQELKRLTLICPQQIALPSSMYKVRQPFMVRLKSLNYWLPLEILLAAFIATYCASHLLFHA